VSTSGDVAGDWYVIRLVDGATILHLTGATGWTATTGAALTELRKAGYAAVRERVGASLGPLRTPVPAPSRPLSERNRL
jgi:hypothetical protein